MSSDKNGVRLQNIPLEKSSFELVDAPFIGSLPETQRVFRRVLGYDLRFFRTRSLELKEIQAEEERAALGADVDRACLRVATFPIGDKAVKVYGYLVLKRDPATPPQLDWEAAKALAESVASTLADNYRWRAEVDACQGELAAAAIRQPSAPLKTRAGFSVRLREILKIGARALGEFDAAALYLLDDATTRLTPRALWGLPDERFLDAPRPLNAARAEVEAFLGNVVVVNDPQTAKDWNVPEDFACSVCVPVVSDTTILGAAWFFGNKKRGVGTREIETLSLISARIVDELEKEAARLRSDETTKDAHREQENKAEDQNEDREDCDDEMEFINAVDSILASVKL